MTSRSDQEIVALAAGGAEAALALRGAEPIVWRVAGRDFLWSGDPAHWDRRAPILFPVVGASAGGKVVIDGASYAMPRHGFARDAQFTLIESTRDSARLRLSASEATRARYPFAFTLDVVARLAPRSLSLTFEIANDDARPLPYALGFHPAFPWPLSGADAAGHRLVFSAEEEPLVPDVTPEGLIAATRRRIPLEGRTLALAHDLFAQDALCFFNARSDSMRFEAPDGAALCMAMRDFPHLALWTKTTAPFLSMECWTGHADPAGFAGELSERPSMRLLAPGATARHAATLSLEGV